MRIKGDVASVTLSEQLEHTADSISTLCFPEELTNFAVKQNGLKRVLVVVVRMG